MTGLLERLHAQATLMPSGCFVWRPDGKGYGQVLYDGKSVGVHRLAWELENGPIPGGLTIDHVRARGCIYKRCINVAHLELVTAAENSRRAMKGRHGFKRDQLANALRDGIKRGEFLATNRIPPLTQLVRDTGLSMTTVQKVIRELVDEGLVIPVPGRGTFVKREGQ